MPDLMHLHSGRVVCSLLMRGEENPPNIPPTPLLKQKHTQRWAGAELLECGIFQSWKTAEGQGCQTSPRRQKPVSPILSNIWPSSHSQSLELSDSGGCGRG